MGGPRVVWGSEKDSGSPKTSAPSANPDGTNV